MKLLLQAFMLSLGCCMEHPLSSMLRQQMLSRLMAVVQAGGSTWLKEWYETQSSMVAGDEAMSAGRGESGLVWLVADQAGSVPRPGKLGRTCGYVKPQVSKLLRTRRQSRAGVREGRNSDHVKHEHL